MEQQEQKHIWAEEILLETGGLRSAVEEAQDLAREGVFDDMTPDEPTEFIKETLNNYGDECGYCAKNRDSD